MEQADRGVHDDLAIDQVGKNSWFEPVQKFVGRPELMGDQYGGGHNFPLRSLLHDALSRRAGLSSGAQPSRLSYRIFFYDLGREPLQYLIGSHFALHL